MHDDIEGHAEIHRPVLTQLLAGYDQNRSVEIFKRQRLCMEYS